jgi:hypothetical protein
MPNVHFDYTTPVTSPIVRSGLTMNEPVVISLGENKATGSFELMAQDPGNPTGPFLVQGGIIFAYSVPLTLTDLTTIMNTIIDRAVALGMIPVAGTLVVDP